MEPLDEQVGARLAAYLDGELDAEGRRAVEELLKRDPRAAEALKRLQEARRLLNEYSTATGASTDRVTPPPEELAGRRVDHFLIEQQIGQGGMGHVYRALDTSLQRPVALKFVSPAIASRPDVVERFVREARLQASLDHPHVAHIYFIGRHEGRLYFAMEYLPGGSLLDRLRRQGRLDPEQAIDIAVEVADILESTRRRGIVHRDLKPSNIMFTADGKIKLTDFGLCKPADEGAEGLTHSGTVLGTPHYISPEAAAGQQVTWKSDMYSLGCTLYHLLFGRPPYSGGGKGPLQVALAHVREPFPEPEHVPDGVSPELMHVLRRMMAKEPSERFPDYASLIEALNAARPKVIRAAGTWRRLVVGALDALLAIGPFGAVAAMVSGVMALTGRPVNSELVLRLSHAAVGLLCFGLIPALSGSTLAQGILALKVRSEDALRPRRSVLLLRGMLAHPVATVGMLSLLLTLLPDGPLRGLAGLLGFVGLLGWHGMDLAWALFDPRRRMLHDVLFRTRLQYVTFTD